MTKSQRILITGAASGIGKHIAQSMLQQGHQLALGDINIAALEEAFGDAPPAQVLTQKLDVTSIESWQALIKAAQEAYGGLDYLFNIAGIITPGFIHKTSIKDLEAQIDINSKGMIFGAKLAADIMVEQGHGHIINVASLAGLVPVSGIAGYTASKFAVRGFSLAIAEDLRPHGVQVTVICPDLVKTPMMDHELDYEEEVALVFTGDKTLTVEDVEQAFTEAMKDKPLEIMLPYSRGLLSKVGSFFPRVNSVLSRQMAKKGREAIKKAKAGA